MGQIKVFWEKPYTSSIVPVRYRKYTVYKEFKGGQKNILTCAAERGILSCHFSLGKSSLQDHADIERLTREEG